MGSNPPYANMCHLRRLFPSKHGGDFPSNDVASLILLDTYVKFGRSDTCDVILTSNYGINTKSSNSTTNMISREHAHINGIKSASGRIEKYMITDHSLNGTYINDYRCRAKCPIEIKEGDIIKFGHMNGASVREGTHSPQANAEFAFVVEKANPSINYLGFRDGRRAKPILCKGDKEICEEGEFRKQPENQQAMNNQPQLGQMPSSVAQTANMINLFPGMYPFPFNPMQIYGPQILQSSGFRAPNIFGNFPQPFPAIPPNTQANLLTTRNIIAQNNQIMNQLLTSSPLPMAPGSDLLTTSSASPIFIPPQPSQVQSKEEVKPTVASPPMECDSSVPSPPKTTITVNDLISPKPKEVDYRSDNSFGESPPPVGLLTTIKRSSSPESEAPLPVTKDVDSDTESRPEEVKKQPATSTSSPPKHRKNNEVSRLLDDLTETSWANTMRRTSTSRRPTEEEMLEKKARKEKKKKEKERTEKTKEGGSGRRMKQLSDESDISSDSDKEMKTKRNYSPKKRQRQTTSDESDSEDEKLKKKKIVMKKTSPKKIPTVKKDPKSRWRARAAEEEAMQSSATESIDDEPVVLHNPADVCELKFKCRHPHYENVQWVQCDDCDGWFHNLCVFGSNDAFTSDSFTCGCKKRLKAAKKTRK